MARITIEDCLKNVFNRYALVHLTTRRARQIFMGSDPLVECKNGEIVTALREIAGGKIQFIPKANAKDNFEPEVVEVAQAAPLPVEQPIAAPVEAAPVAEAPAPVTNGTPVEEAAAPVNGTDDSGNDDTPLN